MEIVLASKSPRRRQLLQAAGLAVEIMPSHVDETVLADEAVETTVLRLARMKAAACPEALRPVIAADTLVCLDGRPIGQPRDLDEARAMIRSLAAVRHSVFTGVCVRRGSRQATDLVRTDVRFRDISEAEIDTYLTHNEVLDKAGAYAVQAGASSFITAIDGPLDNVIGLPVHATLALLQHIAAEEVAA
jgi:nucleoside triphosphate pyrophosphatase